MLGVFAAAYYVSIGSGYTVFFRYMLPLIPIACLSAAAGASWLISQLTSAMPSEPGRMRPLAAHALVLGLTVGPGLINSI